MPIFALTCGSNGLVCNTNTFCSNLTTVPDCVSCADNNSDYPLSDPDDNATRDKCYKECDSQQTIDHGSLTLTGDGRAYVGTECEYDISCDTGYSPGINTETPECQPYTLKITYDIGEAHGDLDWCGSTNAPCGNNQTCHYGDSECVLSSTNYINSGGLIFGGWCISDNVCYNESQNLADNNILNNLIMSNVGPNSTVAVITLAAKWEQPNCDPGEYYNNGACTDCTGAIVSQGGKQYYGYCPGGASQPIKCPGGIYVRSADKATQCSDCYIPKEVNWTDSYGSTINAEVHAETRTGYCLFPGQAVPNTTISPAQ